MIKKSIKIFMGLCLSLVLASAAGGLGLVTLRKQVTRAANHVKRLESRVNELALRENSLDAKIAQAHNPEYLISRLGGGLGLPSERRVVWVQMPQKGESRVAQEGYESPLQVGFEYELIEQTDRRVAVR